MKQMSIERRRVVAMSAATAAISGVGSAIHVSRPQWDIAWICVEALLVTATVTMFVRWKRGQRCRP